jgi:hypothetical protein
LHDAPRIAELSLDESPWRAAEHAKEEFTRLSGHDWPKSWKFVSAQPKEERES